MDILQRWKQTTVANKALVCSGLIVAVGTIVSTGALITQICITRENNRKTSEQVDKIITAANIQAGAAQKIADASDRNAAAADKFSNAAQHLAQASDVANKQNLRFFAEGNRPWLFVQPQEGEEEPTAIKAGVMLTVPLAIRNIGKSPAIKMTEVIRYAKIFTDATEEHKFLTQLVMEVPADDSRNGIITPDTPFSTTAVVDHYLTAFEVDGLLRSPPSVHLVVCGRVEYESPLGPTKPGAMFTEFCYLYYGGLAPNKAHWLPAKYHNQMK